MLNYSNLIRTFFCCRAALSANGRVRRAVIKKKERKIEQCKQKRLKECPLPTPSFMFHAKTYQIKLELSIRYTTKEALIHQKLFSFSVFFCFLFYRYHLKLALEGKKEEGFVGIFCSLHTWHSYSPLSLLWTNLIWSVHVLEPGEWMIPKRSSFVYNWAPDDNMCQSRLLIQDIWFWKIKSQC